MQSFCATSDEAFHPILQNICSQSEDGWPGRCFFGGRGGALGEGSGLFSGKSLCRHLLMNVPQTRAWVVTGLMVGGPLVLFEAPWKPAELTQDYTDVDPKHRNSWPAIGIPGNLEPAQAYLGSHGNTWPAIGIPAQLYEYLATWRLTKLTWAAKGIPGLL